MKIPIEQARGAEGHCLCINDTRVAGPKPWGGGTVVRSWDANVDGLATALIEHMKSEIDYRMSKLHEYVNSDERQELVDMQSSIEHGLHSLVRLSRFLDAVPVGKFDANKKEIHR